MNLLTNASEAIIYFKNGKRKHGLLIEQVLNAGFRFISTTNFLCYQQTMDPNLIEFVDSSLIEGIDTTFK